MSETHFNLKPKDTIMKTNQTIIIAMTAVLLLTLAGCQEPKGYLELKEPKKELSELPPGKSWNVSDAWKEDNSEELNKK
jgi:uncharacterized lipoprotein YajG